VDLTSPVGSGLLHSKAQTASFDQNILYTPDSDQLHPEPADSFRDARWCRGWTSLRG